MQKSFTVPIFNFTVCIATTQKEYLTACKTYELEDLNCEDCGGITNFSIKHRTFVVGLFDRKLKIVNHEVNHVVIRILEQLQMPINDDNSEIFCYLHDYIYGRITEKEEKTKW